MTAEELSDRLALAGLEARVRRGEVVLQVCRFCGNDRWNLELNASSGLYHCWACRAGGRVDSFLRDTLGGDFYLPVRPRARSPAAAAAQAPAAPFRSTSAADVESARRYLHRRGLTDEVIRTYDLGVCVEKGHMLYGRIVIPVRDFWAGQVVGHVGRAYVPSQRPKYLSTLPSRRVTGYRVRDRRAPCVIVEGHFDAIAVHRAGFHVGILAGIDAADVEEFAARLGPDVPLVIMLDGEAVEEARRLRARISAFRPAALAALPPGRDPAEFTPDVLRTLVLGLVR